MIGFDDYCGGGSVVVIEWADKIESALEGTDYVRIELSHMGQTRREIQMGGIPAYLEICLPAEGNTNGGYSCIFRNLSAGTTNRDRRINKDIPACSGGKIRPHPIFSGLHIWQRSAYFLYFSWILVHETASQKRQDFRT
jgi:hypothetical protein